MQRPMLVSAPTKPMSMNGDEQLGFILGRRSIRAYTTAEVSQETVHTLLEAAMAAPSAVAKDPWRSVGIRQRQTLARIAAELPNGQMLASAALGTGGVCNFLSCQKGRKPLK